MRRYLAVLLAGLSLAGAPAYAGLFDDEEARKWIAELRKTIEGIDRRVADGAKQSEVFGRNQLDFANQMENLKAELARVRAEVMAVLRPGVKIVESSHGNLPASALLGLVAAAEDDLGNRPSHHDTEEEHDHEDFESFSVAVGPTADPAALKARILKAVAKFDVLRVKGFVEVPGKPLRHVIPGVGPRLVRHFDRPWKSGESRDGRLVVIGLKGLDRAGIEAEIRG